MGVSWIPSQRRQSKWLGRRPMAVQTQVATTLQAHISSPQPIIHGLMVSKEARHTGDLGLNSLLRHFFINLNQHLASPGPPGGHTVGANSWTTISCDSLIEKLEEKRFVHHHQTSTNLVDKLDCCSSNKVETCSGQTVGGKSNHESKMACGL